MTKVHNLKIKKKKRQYLRNNATKAEKILWQKLKNSQLGYKFNRQHSIKNYIVDFYCPKLKLIIEVDGDVHLLKRQRERDWIKEKYLEKLNFKIIRCSNYDIIENTNKVLTKLKLVCRNIN